MISSHRENKNMDAAIWSEKCEDHLRAKAAVAKRLSYRIPPIPFNSSLSG